MLLYIQIRTKDNKIPKEKIMKLGIRNIEEIRNLNYRKGNNEIYFLETELDEKKEKFKIADAVFEDNNLIYRFVENEKTKEHIENLKTYLKINKYLEHKTIATKKEVLNIITSEEGKTIEKTFVKRSKRIQDISENGKETYSESIEHNVLCTSLEAGSEIYRMLWNFGYEVSEIERKLLGRALLKLLPENNLTEKRELDGWERLVFDQPVKLNAEMLKTAMLVFNYAETVEHKEALNIVREAVEKNITNFPFFSDEAKITLGNEIKFEFNTINKMATMAEKVKEIWGIAKIEEFAAVSMNGIHFKKENETLIVAKENFAKTDFRTLKNLSEIIGIPIECIIRKKYDFFFITGNELKIKVSAWRYEKEKDMIVEEYKCLEEIFEKVSIEKGI